MSQASFARCRGGLPSLFLGPLFLGPLFLGPLLRHLSSTLARKIARSACGRTGTRGHSSLPYFVSTYNVIARPNLARPDLARPTSRKRREKWGTLIRCSAGREASLDWGSDGRAVFGDYAGTFAGNCGAIGGRGWAGADRWRVG